MSKQRHKTKNSPEFRSDSYEASLSRKEREELYDLFFSGNTTEEIRAACIPWRHGPDRGRKPSRHTIRRIKIRLDLEDMLDEIEGTAAFVEATARQLDCLATNPDAEKVLDQAMALVGQEVIHRTLKRLNPTQRTAAAKLLLARADHRRIDRKLKLEESKFALQKSKLKQDQKRSKTRRRTPAENKSRIRHVFGIS